MGGFQFLLRFLLLHIPFPILLAHTVSPCLLVPVLRWRRQLGECQLGDRHARSQDDRHRVEITELECHVEEVTGIDKSCSIMHDESDTREGALARHLDEVAIRPEVIHRNPEDTDIRVEDEALALGDDHFFILGDDAVHRIEVRCREGIEHLETVAKEDVVARRSEPRRIEVTNGDIARLDSTADVTVGEVHKYLLRKDLMNC